MTDKQTETQALADLITENAKPTIITHDKKEFLVHSSSQKVTDLKELTDKHLLTPERRKGTFQIGRTQSFIDFVNRYKTEASALFGRGTVSGNSISAGISAVFNEHPAGDDDLKAGHRDFKAEYQFPVSKELQRWIGTNADTMDQQEFAAFIEDNACDMLDPLSVEADKIAALTKYLGGKPADPIRMIELARGLEVRVKEQVQNFGRIQTGEMQLKYSVEHEGSDGQPLTIPAFFIIGVPVFEGGEPYKIAVRLRYRVSGGKVTWSYDMFKIEQTFDIAFNDTLETITKDTGLPLFITA